MVCPGLVFFRLCLLGLRSNYFMSAAPKFHEGLAFYLGWLHGTVGVGPRLGARVLCSSAPLFRC